MFFEEVAPNSTATASTVQIDSHDFPYPRSGHRIVAYDKYVYSVGGYNPDLWDVENTADTYYPLFKEVWQFNVLTKQWSRLKTTGTTPTEMASHSAAVHHTYLLVFGGTGLPFGPESSSNDLHALNLRTLTWQCLNCNGDKPPKGYGHSMVVHGDDLFVVGGTNGFQYNMDVYHVNLKDPKLEWKNLLKPQRNAELSRPRYRHESVFDNNRLLVFGGGTSNEVYPLSTVDVFSIADGVWTPVDTRPDKQHGFPPPRKCHGLVKHENSAYVMGGTDGITVFDDVWRFDISTLLWTRLICSLPCAVFFHSVAINQDGCVYLFGGVTNVDNSERSCQLYRLLFSPPSLKRLSSERVISICPDFYQSSMNHHLSI